MSNLKIISGYQSDAYLRSKFNDLFQTVFHFNLEGWYKRNYPTDFYIPYSLWDGKNILSNVSISKMNMMVEGVPRKCLQIGTVMTHPDHLMKGYATKLMNCIFEEWESKVEIIFLFSNDKAVKFYSKFGFSEVSETVFTYDPANLEAGNGPVDKLDLSYPRDFNLLEKLAESRMPGSLVFGAIDAKELFIFRALYFSKEQLFFLPDLNVLVNCRKKESILEIYDIVSNKPFDAASVLSRFVEPGIESIRFFFTPDQLSIECNRKPRIWDEAFFIKSETIRFSSEVTGQFCSEA
jgi:GNAT superfamily N-acetyltransferase